MCQSRQRKDGLKMAWTQLVGSSRPSWNTSPAGVYIHELAAMIHT